MSKYTSPYKGSCIYCGDEVSVCLGCQFKVPVSKAFGNPNSCISEDLGTGDLASSSKRASPSQRARQSKKAGSSQKRSAFKVSSICKKKRPNASIKKALQQKKMKAEKDSDGSPEPLFKAVILREMIRLGRQPNIMVNKSVRNVKPIKKCVSEQSYEAENLADNAADLMPVQAQEGEIGTQEIFKPFIMESNEPPRTPSFDYEVQMQNQDYLQSSIMEVDETVGEEERINTIPHYV